MGWGPVGNGGWAHWLAGGEQCVGVPPWPGVGAGEWGEGLQDRPAAQLAPAPPAQAPLPWTFCCTHLPRLSLSSFEVEKSAWVRDAAPGSSDAEGKVSSLAGAGGRALARAPHPLVPLVPAPPTAAPSALASGGLLCSEGTRPRPVCLPSSQLSGARAVGRSPAHAGPCRFRWATPRACFWELPVGGGGSRALRRLLLPGAAEPWEAQVQRPSPRPW